MSRMKPNMPQPVVDTAMAAFHEQAVKLHGMRLALLATPDGFEVASQAGSAPMNIERVSAMTSSLMAMARAVGREVNYSGCNRLIFEADQGLVVVQAVPAKFPTLLCLVLDPGTVLGAAVWAANAISAKLCTVD